MKPATKIDAGMAGKPPDYKLRLFVTGNTACSKRSLLNLRNFCQRFLEGRYRLEVVDICQQPALASEEQIIAAPTLIKLLPPPQRRLVGDFSDLERVASGLDL
ncbi:MAG TPA: circadian clock KaiB family protein [Terriglobales bacterium]|jgi:circadian clock protein KaiB